MRVLIALAASLFVVGSAHAAKQTDAPNVTYIAGNLLGVDLESPATLDFDTPGFAGGGFGSGKGVRVAIGAFTFFLPYSSVTEAYLTPPSDPKLQDKVSRLTFRFSNEAEEEKAVTFELAKASAQRGLSNLRGYLPQLDALPEPEPEEVAPVKVIRERTPALLPTPHLADPIKPHTPLIEVADGPSPVFAKLPETPLLASVTLPAFHRTRVAATLPEARTIDRVKLVAPLLTSPDPIAQPSASLPELSLLASVHLPEPAAVVSPSSVIVSPSVSKIEAKAARKAEIKLLARNETKREKKSALQPKPVPEPVAAQPSKPEEWWGDRYWKTTRNTQDWGQDSHVKDTKRP